MKILVFSDIHGSTAAAQLIVDLAHALRPDHIILLGDILYHGPRNPFPAGYDPKGTAGLLAPLADHIVAIKGNCDSEVDEMVLPFMLSPKFAWIIVDGLRIFATHGHVYSPENLPKLADGDVFLYGHTHLPDASANGSIHFCNPGSLALPKNGQPATYGLFENGTYSVITENGEVYLRLECL